MAVAAAELQQKDNLCGPFQAARILRELGFDAWDGEPLDEDLVALRAGSVLPAPADGSVPPGARSRAEYRYELGTVSPDESGTAAEPLGRAIEEASGGALRCVPICGEWTAERVAALVGGAAPARLLANVRTGGFWGTRPPLEALEAALDGREAEGPPPEWDVGHFCELVALVRGAGGALVVVRDSYPSFGLRGYHLQPTRAVAAALERGDGREGGVLAVTAEPGAEKIAALARELGLENRFWDNGTRR
jgi:hypothetical protein